MIIRVTILLLLMMATAVQAHLQTGMIIAGTGGGAVSGGCSGTSLSFTTACNSMYIPIIH